MRALAGTRIALQGTANKPIREATLALEDGKRVPAAISLPPLVRLTSVASVTGVPGATIRAEGTRRNVSQSPLATGPRVESQSEMLGPSLQAHQ